MTLNNSTLSGNRATRGGGAHNGFDGDLDLYYSTLSGNAGGGFYNEGTAVLNSTIIAKSTGADGDCKHSGSSLFASYSLIEDTGTQACGLVNGANFNVIGQGAGLAPLGNNGGPTETHGLAKNSPALEKGDGSTCPDYDQRGVSRPQGANIGANCDIGAFERKANEMPFRLLMPIIQQNN